MNNNLTVVATVVHAKSLKNLNFFLNSVYSQDDKKFDLLILNDSKKQLNLKNKFIKIFSFRYNKSINENRIKLIKEIIKRKYKKVIFIDSDDLMIENRVSICKKYLNKNKIVVNDLNIFDKNLRLLKKNYFSSRIKNNAIINKSSLSSKNFFGMSNTSCEISIFKKLNLDFLKNAPIFDWALWATALTNNKAIFINSTTTNYLIDKNSLTYFDNKKKECLLKQHKLKNMQLKFFLQNNIFNINEISKNFSNSSKNRFWWE